ASRQPSGALLKQIQGPVVRQGWRHAITNRRLLVVAGTRCTGPDVAASAILVSMTVKQQH
ncbi:unnamed protein product, partial [Tetraodon nigroviridis]